MEKSCYDGTGVKDRFHVRSGFQTSKEMTWMTPAPHPPPPSKKKNKLADLCAVHSFVRATIYNIHHSKFQVSKIPLGQGPGFLIKTLRVYRPYNDVTVSK